MLLLYLFYLVSIKTIALYKRLATQRAHLDWKAKVTLLLLMC